MLNELECIGIQTIPTYNGNTWLLFFLLNDGRKVVHIWYKPYLNFESDLFLSQ